ncbi:uncharacterized protein LOC144866627 [Branchiostoma floridae x Branchiostoma japonicum]
MLGRLLLTAAVVLAAIQGSGAQGPAQATQNEEIAMTECPDGQPLVYCIVDPCSTVLCRAGTQCVSNYCGGCNAECVPIKPPVRCTSWTNWFDRDNPSVTGDWETLSNLQQENPGRICKAPTAIEARVVGTGQDALTTGENFAFCDATTGFVCRKDDQPDNTCLDYEVRFCCPDVVPDCPAGSWTPWYDRDNPSVTGDWETLGSLRKENPGRICFSPTAVHARVISTQVEASLAGEVLYKYDTTSGFACRKVDQDDNTCLEYEVRFCCPPCPRWTPWFDRDNPSATGDWEVLSHLRPENPGQICRSPTDIQVRVKGTEQDAFLTGEVFVFYDVTTGFVCKKDDQPDNMCLDYEVRFCCPRTCARWTQWFDRDNISGTGDWEILYALANGNPVGLRPEYPGQICPRPTDVEARVIATQQEASQTGETFVYYDTANGFACRNNQQRDQRCLDYEVRFCCPDPYCPSGDPFLPNYYCGRGGQRCPPGYYCEIEPADAWAVCCPSEVVPTMPPPPPTREPKTPVCSLDLVLVVDLSSSISMSAFFSIKRFIIDLIYCFIEFCVDVEIGIITYDCVPTWFLPVCTYPMEDPTLIDTVNCLMYTAGGETHTGGALRYMTDTADFRDGFPRAAVVITDGQSGDEYTAEANAARAAGIGLWGVAAGHPLLLNPAALVDIAGGSDRVFGTLHPAACELAQRILAEHCGRCPDVNGPGLCVEMCGDDSDCRPGQLCCSNGCGHTCQDAVFG